MEAVRRFEAERSAFHPAALRKNAERFSKAVFMGKMKEVVKDFLETPGGAADGRGGMGYPSALKAGAIYILLIIEPPCPIIPPQPFPPDCQLSQIPSPSVSVKPGPWNMDVVPFCA